MGKKPKKGGPVVDDWENDIDEIANEKAGGDDVGPQKSAAAAPETVSHFIFLR